MSRQDLIWFGIDMILGVKVCDPNRHQKIGTLIKVPPDEQILSEIFSWSLEESDESSWY